MNPHDAHLSELLRLGHLALAAAGSKVEIDRLLLLALISRLEDTARLIATITRSRLRDQTDPRD